MEKVELPPEYKPSDDEPYMSKRQLTYFKNKLLKWKEDLLNKSSNTLNHLKELNLREPDPNDQASNDTETSIELRTRDRDRKLIEKINDALEKIETGEYGYCEETGNKIGLGRLEARPVATLCIEAQERHEKFERTHRDDDA